VLNVCRGLSYVRIVSPKFDANGGALLPLSPIAASRLTVGGASAFPVAVVLCAATGASTACLCMWCVLRKVVCRSCAAPVIVVEMVLDGLEEGRWDQLCVADVLLDAHSPAVGLCRRML